MNEKNDNAIMIQYLFGVFLALYTYFFYLILPISNRYDAMLNVTFMSFIFFILISAYFYEGNYKKYIDIKKYSLFPLLFWFLIAFVLYGSRNFFVDNPNYYSFLARNFYYLSLIILFVSLINQKVLERMLTSIYVVYFLFGFYLTVKLFLADSNRVIIPIKESYIAINENVIGFLILPFLSYFFIKMKDKKVLVFIYYLFGLVLLYFTNAWTSLVSFALLPLFIIGIKVFKNKLRLFIGVYLISAFSLILLLSFVIYPYFGNLNEIFNGRLFLWKEYINYVIGTKAFIIGTGNWILPNIESLGLHNGINSHNQFITILFFNGIIGVVCYVLFIINAIPKIINKIRPSHAVLFSLLTVQLAESIVPFFDFGFLSFLFLLSILKLDSEEF